jgi:hypothetical protein
MHADGATAFTPLYPFRIDFILHLLNLKRVPETEIKMLVRIRARPMPEADNLTAISEPIV